MQKGLASIKNELFTTWQSLSHYRLVIGLDQSATRQVEEAIINMPVEIAASLGKEFFIEVGRVAAHAAQVSTMLRWMQRFFLQTHAFPLQLNNFSGIPPHLLYMRVQCTGEVLSMRAQIEKLNQYLKGYELPEFRQPSKWMLPVCEGLSGMDYDKALQHFAKLELAMQIPVKELQLQKQSNPDQPWQLVQRLPFQSPVVYLHQPWYSPCTGLPVA